MTDPWTLKHGPGRVFSIDVLLKAAEKVSDFGTYGSLPGRETGASKKPGLPIYQCIVGIL